MVYSTVKGLHVFLLLKVSLDADWYAISDKDIELCIVSMLAFHCTQLTGTQYVQVERLCKARDC